MDLINNRFRIEKGIEEVYHSEAYLVSDLWDKEKSLCLKFLNIEDDRRIIEYFIGNFLDLSMIKHKNLLECKYFDLVDTIDLKRINFILPYIVSECVNGLPLSQISGSLNLRERLFIILDLMGVIDYLHFRGVVYRLLSPSFIFLDSDKSVKIMDMSTIAENIFSSYYDELTRHFIAPELIRNYQSSDYKVDYYSLGMIMKYLFYEDPISEDLHVNSFKNELISDEKQEEALLDIIINLTNRDPSARNIPLRNHIDRIIDVFQLDYQYDLIKERSHVFYRTRLIGREKQLKDILKIDEQLINGTNNYNIAFIKSSLGTGKSRFLDEVSFQLKMRGRDVFKIDIKENDSLGLLNLSSLLKQSIKSTPIEILNKHREDLKKLLPELGAGNNINIEVDLTNLNERYRLFNRINHYFSDLSKEKVIYIIIDDLDRSSDIFIAFVDYLISNLNTKRIFFIVSTSKEDYLINNDDLKNKINSWTQKGSVINTYLPNLNEEDTGKLIKAILGISYIPKKFANSVYKVSHGNPRAIDYLIKDLISKNELYMVRSGWWELGTDDYSELPLNADINESIQTQLKNIKADHLEVLKALSIFNNSVPKRILSKMLDNKVSNLDIILETIFSDRLIIAESSEWEFDYHISGNELKRLIYYRIAEDEKLELHKEAANALLQIYGDKLNLILEELIFHLVKSKDYSRATDIILREASKLENVYSANSIFLWEQAYEITKAYPCLYRLKILNTLADIYSVKGNIEKSEQYIDELIIESKKYNDYRYLVKAKYYKADNYLKKDDIDSINREVQEMMELSRKNNYPEGIIMSLIMKTRANLNSTNTDYISDILDEAISISETYNITEFSGTLYNLIGLNNYLMGNTEDAIINYKKSIEEFEKSGDEIQATKPINNIGNIYSEIYGDIETSLEYYERGLRITEKYGFLEASTVFLNNIGEIYLNQFDNNKALDYIEASRKLAVESGNSRVTFLTYVNLGIIYLSTSRYDKAHNCYCYLEESYRENPVSDLSIVSQYYIFLGEYYRYFGLLDKAIKYFEMSNDICKDYNINQYLKGKSRILICKYISGINLDHKEIKEIVEQYEKSGFDQDNVVSLLHFIGYSLYSRDMELAEYLLKVYDSIEIKYEDKFISDVYQLFKYCMDNIEENIYEIEAIFKRIDFYCDKSIRMNIHMMFGFILFEKKMYTKAIKHLLESLDLMYRCIVKIPTDELKYSFINKNRGDSLKKKIFQGIELAFGKKVDEDHQSNVAESDLDSYFSLNSVLEIISHEEFNKILYSDEKDDSIKNSEKLLSLMTDDYNSNLSLILQYMAKETLAERGYILEYDDNTNTYIPITSIGKESFEINDNVLIQSSRNNIGILINKNFKNMNTSPYMDFLTEDLMGIICVPLNISEGDAISERDRRRKDIISNKRCKGYIYLETSRSLNRFDFKRFKLISSLAFLVYLNMENNSLKILSTIDKLTGTLTRKYFDNEFNNILNRYKNSRLTFSVLMIDVDRFKDVNDTYGHLKGDEVLSYIGKTIKSSIRTSDLVCRYGGEEFIVLLQNTNEEESLLISEKLRTKVKEMKVPGVEYPVTISIGVAHYPSHGQFREDLIGRADQALYYAKEILGRNTSAIWNSEMSNASNRMDKLAGLITGNTDTDNRNILALIDIIELIKSNNTIKEKTFAFLGKLLDTVDGESSSLFIVDGLGNIKEPFTRVRKKPNWGEPNCINVAIVSRVATNKKGEFLIDWDNTENIDLITGVPNWQSIIVLPVIKNDIVKGVVYISVPIKEKEFTFNDYNIAKTMTNIFASNM